LSWVGIEEKFEDVDKVKSILTNNGFIVLGRKNISVKTSRGWINFLVFDVGGFTEGMANLLSKELNVIALESGKHLILGETSAKLWDEAVKIVFPDGESEIIPVFTFDGFLDLRMPTENIRGVNPTIVIFGKVYNLPLTIEDIVEIYRKNKKGIEKIEKAASIYGLEKVISKEAIDALKEKRDANIKVEIDYETGYVLISNGFSINTRPLSSYFLSLILEDKINEALNIYNNAPINIKEDLKTIVVEEFKIQKNLGAIKNIERLKKFIDKIKNSSLSGSS